MLTPPYHFSIVACPSITTLHNRSQDDTNAPPELLYRGSIPATRNLPFIKRLGLRTIVYLRKKAIKDDDVLYRWAGKRGVELKWVKAEAMGEEKLGMGKTEVGEVLKIILNPASYPLYIADLDGISHTTLIVACLRKLQGWHQDSIVNEICRFEPEYEDLPLVPFIISYLTNSSSDPSLALPPPPYPSWLWPASAAISPPLTRTTTRERTTSNTSNSATSSALPFPHPLQARRHPTMKVTFPPLPASSSPQVSSNPSQSGATNPSSSSRVESRRGPSSDTPSQGLLGTATSIITSGISGLVNPTGSEGKEKDDRSKKFPRTVSFDENKETSAQESTSPEKLSREPTNLSSDGVGEAQEIASPVMMDDEDGIEPDEEDEDEDEDDDDDYDDEDDDDDDENEEQFQETSQYISALDLAGFA